MDSGRFIHLVQDRAGITDHERAEEVAHAVLAALHARIGSEAEHLASQLPESLREWFEDTAFIAGGGGAAAPTNGDGGSDRPRRIERFGWDEMCRRVGESSGLDPVQAERAARAVFATLHEQVSRGEARHVAAQLPGDIEQAWTDAATALDIELHGVQSELAVPPASEEEDDSMTTTGTTTTTTANGSTITSSGEGTSEEHREEQSGSSGRGKRGLLAVAGIGALLAALLARRGRRRSARVPSLDLAALGASLRSGSEVLADRLEKASDSDAAKKGRKAARKQARKARVASKGMLATGIARGRDAMPSSGASPARDATDMAVGTLLVGRALSSRRRH